MPLVILLTMAIDQLSKLIVQRLMVEGQSVAIISHILYLTYTRNPGAAFGLFPHRKIIFIIVSALVIALMLAVVRRVPERHRLLRAGMGLVIGGAAGNLIDRLRFGMVVDFLDFRVWPVFNLADSAIVIGACLIALGLWRDELRLRTGERK